MRNDTNCTASGIVTCLSCAPLLSVIAKNNHPSSIVTAHGKTKAHLHRFKIIDSPECPCEAAPQTVDHLIYECQKLKKERKNLIRTTAKKDTWPIGKRNCEQTYKTIYSFTNSIDFEKI
jgi:hypothetical protein